MKTYDSHLYLSIVENLYSQGRFAGSDGQPVVHLAPLYPILLSFASPYYDSYVFWLHLCCMCATLVFWLKMAGATVLELRYQVCFGFSLALCTPLLMIATFVWSETVFLLLFTTYLFCWQRLLTTDNHRWIWLASLTGFLMLLQRNAGIFLLIGTIIGLLFYYAKTGFQKDRIKYLALHLCVALSGFVAWNLSKIVLANRPEVIDNWLLWLHPPQNASLIMTELGKTMFPHSLPYSLGKLLALSMLAFIGYFSLKNREKEPFIWLLCMALFTYLFIWIIILTSSEELSRYLAVILPLFYLLLFYSLSSFRKLLTNRPKKALDLGVVISLAYPLLRIIHSAWQWGGHDGAATIFPF